MKAGSSLENKVSLREAAQADVVNAQSHSLESPIVTRGHPHCNAAYLAFVKGKICFSFAQRSLKTKVKEQILDNFVTRNQYFERHVYHQRRSGES